jgi:LacI family transcriptional regulator
VQGGYLATRHLIEQGCKRIVFSSGPIFLDNEYFRIIHEARLRGCTKALEEAGMPTNGGEALFVEERDPNHAAQLAADVKEHRIDGIVGFSDYLCMVVMDSLRRTNIRIPDDVRIIGFDDTAFNKFTAPPLTSIGFPKAELGRTMVEALLRMAESKVQDTDEILLRPNLVVRESSSESIPPDVVQNNRATPKRRAKTNARSST